MEYSSLFVCLMGMGTVFFGLICLIALTMAMGAIVGRSAPAAAPVPAAPAPAVVNRAAAASGAPAAPEANRQEIAAAVSAAIAEELGADITGIRILSMKKL